ncbi:MAG: hypothetical protein ABIJ00_12795 [Candidatus Eisenbacteria bacterium]
MRPKTICLLLAGLLMVVGCAKEGDIALPNLPPETYMALADSVRNPTVYIQEVRWWGSDADGEVAGFEYRWFSDPSESGCPIDPAWVFTEELSHTFHLPVTDGLSSHRIEVRAVDDDDAIDPTPSSLTLPVTNSPPTVKLWDRGALPHTTLPALVIRWHGDDPEGSETIDHYAVWLDGEEDSPLITAAEDTTISIGFDYFDGRYGERTLYLVAIDSGCDTSAVVTYTWQVEEIEGDVLLVDDLWNYAGAWLTDPFYRNAVGASVGDFSVLDMYGFSRDHADPASYAFNFEELFRLFPMVVWYTEPARGATSRLKLVEDLVPSYIEGGGRLLLVSLDAVGTNGAFPDSVFLPIFGIDSLYTNLMSRTTNFDCVNWEMKANGELGLDSLKVSGHFPGVECLEPAAGATPLYHIAPFTITGFPQTRPYYLGVLNSWGSGKVALVTAPVSRSNGYLNADAEIRKIIELVRD